MSWDDSLQLMNHLTDQVQNMNYILLFEAAQHKYSLSEFKIAQITPKQAYQIYVSICKSIDKKPSKKNAPPESQLSWGENELKVFIWVLMCYLELKMLSVQNLNTQDWQFFSKLFPKKKKILFQYQALNLRKDNFSPNKWSHQQDQILSELVSGSDQKNKWSEHAKQLYILSDKKYLRAAKQCRQRWLNHLDPSKSKQEWQLREDYILIAHVHSKGKKWAQIAKMLKNRRNQHSIKNRFKSMITKEQKLHSDKFEEKELVRLIYNSYQAQFTEKQFNLAEISNKNQIQQAEVNLQKYGNDLMTQTKQTFQISASSIGKSHLKDSACFSSTNHLPAHLKQYMISSFHSDNLHNPQIYQRSQLQKQIRADMFLSIDPFQFLKRFFHSKDSQTID